MLKNKIILILFMLCFSTVLTAQAKVKVTTAAGSFMARTKNIKKCIIPSHPKYRTQITIDANNIYAQPYEVANLLSYEIDSDVSAKDDVLLAQHKTALKKYLKLFGDIIEYDIECGLNLLLPANELKDIEKLSKNAGSMLNISGCLLLKNKTIQKIRL